MLQSTNSLDAHVWLNYPTYTPGAASSKLIWNRRIIESRPNNTNYKGLSADVGKGFISDKGVLPVWIRRGDDSNSRISSFKLAYLTVPLKEPTIK